MLARSIIVYAIQSPATTARLLPHGVVAVVAGSADELLEQVRDTTPACVVVDGVDLDSVTAARVVRAAAATGAATVIIDPPSGVAGMERCFCCRRIEAAQEVPRLVRYICGEPLRLHSRVLHGESARVEVPGQEPVCATILDLSETGARLQIDREMDRPLPLRLPLGGTSYSVMARPARPWQSKSRGQGFEFVDVTAPVRAALRAFVAAARFSESRIADLSGTPNRLGVGRKLIGGSGGLLRTLEIIHRAAPTDEPVLIVGETGTGKELIARALHDGSRRADKPFVAINCAALPFELIESELFGHEAGAFTGATKRKIGRIEQASGGTLFLDEIGELPAAAQPKLLRALQEWRFERVGGTESVRADVRLVAATNRDLTSARGQESFRRDLFFRINVLTVEVPPLRARPEDIGPLSECFLARAQARMGKSRIELSEEAAERLLAYCWPGNVRELENVCSRAVMLHDSGTIIRADQLGLRGGQEPPASALPRAELRELVDYCEREIVNRVLADRGGNRTRAAHALGISRQALQQKLQRYRAEAPAAAIK